VPDTTTPVLAGLFAQGADGPHLIGGRCRQCERHHFPQHALCPYCSADAVEEARLSSEGTLWAWTSVHAPPPGYRGEVPFGFGVVELPEGVRVITRLTEIDPDELDFGQRMRLTVVPLHEDDDGRTVVTYAFVSVAK
jgi:uncharacterized OB-fold protein